MNQRKNNDESKGRKKDPKNMKVLSSKNDEDFNTGSHSPSRCGKLELVTMIPVRAIIYNPQRVQIKM